MKLFGTAGVFGEEATFKVPLMSRRSPCWNPFCATVKIT